MKLLVCSVLLVLVSLPALGEGTGTFIAWPEWRIYSTEDTYMGRRHTSFPLTYLVDGDPDTAWVFSGLTDRPDGQPARYAIALTRDWNKKGAAADSIRIMNGYNKSRELFERNNRITELKLEVNGKLLKTVRLSDEMGWHTISIPRQVVRSVRMEFTGFVKGRDDDVCVSEIELLDRGRKIDLKMPKAVVYTEGSECGCGQEFCVIDRDGKRLATDDSEGRPHWSPDGTRVAGLYCIGETWRLWVVDMTKPAVVYDKRSPDQQAFEAVWADNHTVRLSPYPEATAGMRVRVD